MPQLILSNIPGRGDSVLEVLADGAYPGFDVVENQDPVVGWNSRPKPKFRSIHVLAGAVSDFDDLMESTVDEPGPTLPKLSVNFLPAQASEIAQERTIVVANSAALRRKPNPALGG